MTQFCLTEEEHNFLASLDYNELIREIGASCQDTLQQSSKPIDIQLAKPTKVFYTFL